jgi:hypothetical protein
MANLANYTLIAGLVKDWAGKLSDPHIVTMNEHYDVRRDAIVADMLAFSNGLERTVATFNGIFAVDNVVRSNDFVMVKVSNCRRFPNAHPPHIYDDHGTDLACWGERF